jgi:hypothetical protein
MKAENKTKVCLKCGGNPKPITEFYKDIKAADGRLSVCTDCRRAQQNKRNESIRKERELYG